MYKKKILLLLIVLPVFNIFSQTYYAGEYVKIKWHSKWYFGKILKASKTNYYITYIGYKSKWNEWVKSTRLKKIKRNKNIFQELTNKYGVKIYYKINSSFLPSYWKRSPINGRVIQIEKKELYRFPRLLKQAFSKYPAQVLKKNLKAVYLSKKIMFYGVNYGGTYIYDKVYMSSRGKRAGFTDTYIMGTFHHEFSSILMKHYSFPKREWSRCNKRGFHYGKGGIKAIQGGSASLKGTKKYYTLGFLSQYSTSAVEEDFNVFSERVFTKPHKIKRLIRKYPILRKKFNVWVKFYHSIHPIFTKEYFLGKWN